MNEWEDTKPRGDWGESLIHASRADILLAPPDERRYDLLLEDGRKVEVKTDSYPLGDTPNFCMERTSQRGGGTWDGGPWRSARDGIEVFVYLFRHPVPTAWWFEDVPALVARLEELIAARRCHQRFVYSGGIRAACWLVRRKLLCAGLAHRIEQYEGRTAA